MTNLVEIKKEPILISSAVLDYNRPDYIYLPLNGKAVLNSKVKIGSLVIQEATKKVCSPISGTIKGTKVMSTKNGKSLFLEIENDFQELREIEPTSKKNLNKMPKETLNQKILDVLGISFNEKKNFVLNCLDDEPYILTQNFYLMNYGEEFLELLDELAAIFKLEKVILCVKATSSENISNLTSMLGMYPIIELQICPDLYLLGETHFLLDYLDLPEEDTVVITANKFHEAYNYIKRNRYTSTKFLTISGSGVKNPAVINVKIGTKLKDVIKEYFTVLENVIYLAGGLMRGTEINIEDFIIDDEISGIIITQKEERIESSCIHCGACTRICPYGLNPTLLRLPKYRAIAKNTCTNCGLCSYICPANIDFNKFWKGDNNE